MPKCMNKLTLGSKWYDGYNSSFEGKDHVEVCHGYQRSEN